MPLERLVAERLLPNPARAALPPQSRTRRAWPLAAALPALIAAMLIAAVLAGAWLGPALLDWNRYRGQIARYASTALGRPVRIDGPVGLVLLPEPVLTAHGVSLADAGDGISVAAPLLRLRLARTPLLWGQLIPRELTLGRPQIRLPWPLPTPAADRPNARPHWLDGARARIEDGTLAIGPFAVTAVNVALTANPTESGAGYSVQGSLRALGQSWRVTQSVGADGPDGALVSLQIVPNAAKHPPDATAWFSGRLTATAGLNGRVHLAGADLPPLLGLPRLPFQADGPISLAGPAKLAPDLAPDLAITCGGVAARASLRLENGTLIAGLQASRLDLDALPLGALRRGARPALPALALPWPVQLHAQASGARLRGGLLRDLRLDLDLAHGQTRITQASAILPGEAALAFTGLVQPGPGLGGDISLNAPQLRATLGWLGAAGIGWAAALPATVLPNAAITARLALTPDQLALTQIAGTLAGSPLSGRLSLGLNAESALDAALTLDRLALDDWLPPAWPGWPDLETDLARIHAHLQLAAPLATWRGRTLDDLQLDVATAAGGLALKRLGFGWQGARLELAGGLDASGQISAGQLDLHASSAASLGQLLPARWRLNDFLWSGPIAVHAEAVGPANDLVASLGVDLADARLEAHPHIDLTHGAWSAQMTLRHPGAPRLLGALGLGHARDWLGEGSFSLLAQLAGTPTHIKIETFDLTAGTLAAHGALDLDIAKARLTGQIAADTLPLPAFNPHSREPMTFAWAQGWTGQIALAAAHIAAGDTNLLDQARATLSLDHGILAIAQGAATLGGGTLGLTASLTTTATPPTLSVQASLAAATLNAPLFGTAIDLASGRYDATLAATAAGFSPAALLASLAGKLTLTGADGTLSGLNLAAATSTGQPGAAFSQTLATGATPFAHLAATATLTDGIATLAQTSLDGTAGAATADGTLDLPDGSLSVLAHLPNAIDLRLTGALAAPRAVAELPRS